MAAQTRGYCKYCGKEYTRSGMLRHLTACKKRKEKLEAEGKKKLQCGYFQLLLTGRYQTSYWLIIEIKETATLKELDQFIRNIWVECCGHLSAFTIDGMIYEENHEPFGFGSRPVKNLNCRLKDVVSVGTAMNYKYDFGSTTELQIKVQAYRNGLKTGNNLVILSRNHPPEILCSHCGKEMAQWVNPEGYYDGEPFWCEACLKKQDLEAYLEEGGTEEEYEEECEEDEFPFDDSYLLPVCNSPRMGVCGYEGSDMYPDQFEPDVKAE